jgi:glycine betaine/proline transport system ATP-binding protein
MIKINIKNLYKSFGPGSENVHSLLEKGMSKEEIFEETGQTLGLIDISLAVNAGKIFVVMGLSGSGKSTLLRCINRLIEPTSGEISIDGVNILEFNKVQLRKFRREKTGMVFQHFGLFPHRTVQENIAYGLKVQGVDKAQRNKQADTWIETVGLAGYAQAYPEQLSGGMQQRVGLARAFCTDPEILLMDEPFSALDPLIRREMQDELISLQERFKKTVIFISHDLREALRIGDYIAILRDGRIIQVGTPDDIVKNPADDYVAAFVQDSDC